MPRYFFHLHNDVEACDEDGVELPDLAAARTEAIRAARDLMAEAVRQGEVKLGHWIEVHDAAGNQVLAISFGDAVRVAS